MLGLAAVPRGLGEWLAGKTLTGARTVEVTLFGPREVLLLFGFGFHKLMGVGRDEIIFLLLQGVHPKVRDPHRNIHTTCHVQPHVH